MSKLEERKANYQAAIDKNMKSIQQLSTAIEQLRGAVALCDELLKEELAQVSTDSNEQTQSNQESQS